MPNFCAIIGCGHRGQRDEKSFYRLPAVITKQCEKTENFSRRRHTLWLSRIARDDIRESSLQYVRVCSDHFISGKPANLYDDTNPDWAPSINLGHHKLSTAATPSSTERYNRKRQRTEKVMMDPEGEKSEDERNVVAPWGTETEDSVVVHLGDDLARMEPEGEDHQNMTLEEREPETDDPVVGESFSITVKVEDGVGAGNDCLEAESTNPPGVTIKVEVEDEDYMDDSHPGAAQGSSVDGISIEVVPEVDDGSEGFDLPTGQEATGGVSELLGVVIETDQSYLHGDEGNGEERGYPRNYQEDDTLVPRMTRKRDLTNAVENIGGNLYQREYPDQPEEMSEEYELIDTSEGLIQRDDDHQTLAEAENVEGHQPVHTIGDQPRCDHCGKIFAQAEGLRRHMLIHRGEKPYQCEYCDRAFTQAGHLRRHVPLHTGERRHKCEQCDKAYTHAAGLKRHMMLHTGERPYQCRYCDKTYREGRTLRRHVLHVHNSGISHQSDGASPGVAGVNTSVLVRPGERSHQCETCDKTFLEEAELNRHLRVHRPPSKIPQRCSYCGKEFTRADQLKRHILIHTGDRPYQCEYCDKAFTQLGNFNRHMRLHKGGRSYQCEHCDKTYTRLAGMKRHMIVHTGERPHQCIHCGKAFYEGSALNRHMEEVHVERPHRCEHCDRAFVEAKELNRHILCHTGEKPHKCEHCDKAYSAAFYLEKHMAVHTAETAMPVKTLPSSIQ